MILTSVSFVKWEMALLIMLVSKHFALKRIDARMPHFLFSLSTVFVSHFTISGNMVFSLMGASVMTFIIVFISIFIFCWPVTKDVVLTLIAIGIGIVSHTCVS